MEESDQRILNFLDDDMKEEIRKYLCSKDTNHNGYIESEELEECLWGMGFSPTPGDVTFLQQHLDKNGDGKLEIQEFINNLEILFKHSVTDEDLMHSFKLFDRNNDGYISTSELMTILLQNNFMSLEQAQELIQNLLAKFDVNGDKRFDYSEFTRIFKESSLMPSIRSKLMESIETSVHQQN